MQVVLFAAGGVQLLLDAPARHDDGDAVVGVLDLRLDGERDGGGDGVAAVDDGVLAEEDHLAVAEAAIRVDGLVARRGLGERGLGVA